MSAWTDELTRELRAHGLAEVRLRLSGLAQFVSARKPDANPGERRSTARGA